MASKVECPECGKGFRGQGGLDWHMQRSGHSPDPQEAEADLTAGPTDPMTAVSSTIDMLGGQIGDIMRLHGFYRLLGTAPVAPERLVQKLHDLTEVLASTRR